jgi:hypothetical protein
MSNDELAKLAGMSDRHIRRVKKSLCKKNLITITFRKKEDGGPDTDLITIIDLWLENFEFYKAKKEQKNKEKNMSYEQGGVRTGSPDGTDCQSGKEDLSDQDLSLSSTYQSNVHNSVDSSMKEANSSIPSCEQSLGSHKSTSNGINDLLKRYTIKDQWKIKPNKLDSWRKYSLEEIETAIKYIFQQLATKGTIIENFEAYMEKALQNKWKPLSKNALKNLKAAAFFKKQDRLNECLIHSNCCVNISTSKDLGFELDPTEFKKRFTEMFKRPWTE